MRKVKYRCDECKNWFDFELDEIELGNYSFFNNDGFYLCEDCEKKFRDKIEIIIKEFDKRDVD